MGQVDWDGFIVVSLDPKLKKYDRQLQAFFSGMLAKLALNSHKDTPEKSDTHKLTALLLRELAEFLEQVSTDRTSQNTIVELWDVANFAFLASVALQPGINGGGSGKHI